MIHMTLGPPVSGQTDINIAQSGPVLTPSHTIEGDDAEIQDQEDIPQICLYTGCRANPSVVKAGTFVF